jgi:putative molybdopterin biosynthesis protein
MASAGDNRVRAFRDARGLSQVALAERSGLTRQSIGAIEAGRAVPAVDVALRLARALGCQVEELFGAAGRSPLIDTEPSAPGIEGRVMLAHIGGRWVSYPLGGEGVRISADGFAVAGQGGSLRVEPVRTPFEATGNVVVMGCAAGLGLLCDRLNARAGPGRFLWLSTSSTAALEALAKGHTHLAGVHLMDAATGEANVVDVGRVAIKETIVLITLARWEAGLVLRPDDAARVRSVSDLGQPGLRLVVREPGAGARRLLEREVRAVGLPDDVVSGACLRAMGHIDVARAVAMGAADTGIATRDAAMVFGLRFVPLVEERYDLAVSLQSLTDPRVARLLDMLATADLRRELASLGYDTRASGDRVAEVHAPC